MADGHFPTLVSKDRNANAIANGIFVHISDGTDQLAVNADGSLNVTVTGGASNTQFAEDSAHVTGDIGTEMLSVRRDTPISGTSADGDYATLNTDADGRLYTQIHDGGNSITVDGTVAVSSVAGTVTVAATDLDIRDLDSATDSVEVLQAAHDSLNANANIQVGNADVANGNPVPVSDAGGSLTVDATDLDIRDLTLAADSVKVSKNTSANAETNPIWVKEGDTDTNTEVHDYDTAATVASDATSDHDYTVVNATFFLKKVTFAASGGGKVELQVGPVASLVSKRVGFIPKEGGQIEWSFNPPIPVPVTSTGTVRLIRTNRQGQAQDLYSSIEGNDIA